MPAYSLSGFSGGVYGNLFMNTCFAQCKHKSLTIFLALETEKETVTYICQAPYLVDIYPHFSENIVWVRCKNLICVHFKDFEAFLSPAQSCSSHTDTCSISSVNSVLNLKFMFLVSGKSCTEFIHIHYLCML